MPTRVWTSPLMLCSGLKAGGGGGGGGPGAGYHFNQGNVDPHQTFRMFFVSVSFVVCSHLHLALL